MLKLRLQGTDKYGNDISMTPVKPDFRIVYIIT